MKGEKWFLRWLRFTLKHLKDFGFGRAGLEGVIQGEVKTIIRNKSQFLKHKLKHLWSMVIVKSQRLGWGSDQPSYPPWWEGLQDGNGLLPNSFQLYTITQTTHSGVWNPSDQCSLDDCCRTTIQLFRPKSTKTDGASEQVHVPHHLYHNIHWKYHPNSSQVYLINSIGHSSPNLRSSMHYHGGASLPPWCPAWMPGSRSSGSCEPCFVRA